MAYEIIYQTYPDSKDAPAPICEPCSNTSEPTLSSSSLLSQPRCCCNLVARR